MVKHNLRSGKVVKELYMSEDNAMRRADDLDAEGKMATVVLLEERSRGESPIHAVSGDGA